MSLQMKLMIATLAAGVQLFGCASIKPYEKEYLLNPLMDDAFISTMQPGYAKAMGAQQERLASGGAGGGGTSCPTCGG